MKTLGEIDPEVRGLLEEIVADPRSSIRLVPRKPLKSWFDSGETLNPREVSSTKAERHLIEAHREAVAQLLYEGAKISFWKEQNLAFRPTESDGTLFDEAKAEATWRPRAVRGLDHSKLQPTLADLLLECAAGIASTHMMTLAQASLSLVPQDKARIYLALTVQRSSPRTALRLLNRLAGHVNPPAFRSIILSGLAGSLHSVGLLFDSREAHRGAVALNPLSTDRFCVFNISCCLGDEEGARGEAMEIDKVFRERDPRLLEAATLLRSWAKTKSPVQLPVARRVASRISPEFHSARILCQALET